MLSLTDSEIFDIIATAKKATPAKAHGSVIMFEHEDYEKDEILTLIGPKGQDGTNFTNKNGFTRAMLARDAKFFGSAKKYCTRLGYDLLDARGSLKNVERVLEIIDKGYVDPKDSKNTDCPNCCMGPCQDKIHEDGCVYEMVHNLLAELKNEKA